MAAMPACEEDDKLASKCLEFCQMLAGKSPTFSFSLNIGSSFSFSVDTRGKEVLATHRKKKTPSTLRRDARRREEFLKKKKLSSSTENSSQSEQASAREAETPMRAQTVLKHHPSPAAAERRQVIVVGRENEMPSFNQLDGQHEDASLLCSSSSSAPVEKTKCILTTFVGGPVCGKTFSCGSDLRYHIHECHHFNCKRLSWLKEDPSPCFFESFEETCKPDGM